MKFGWQNKVVIITGSSIGIGRVLAKEIGFKGAKIVINGRNKEKLKSTYDELIKLNIEVFPVQGDVSDFNSCKNIVQQTVNKFGKIDVLINNAGIASYGSFENTSVEVFKKVVETNLFGTVNMTKAAFSYLKKTNGNILFIGSLAGIHGVGDYSAYSCSKMALNSLAESLRIELFDSEIRLGIVYVGFTENDSQKFLLDTSGKKINVPSRAGIQKMPQTKVAKKIIRMIEKKKFRATFTGLGKITSLLNRISPNIIHQILLLNYKRGI